MNSGTPAEAKTTSPTPIRLRADAREPRQPGDRFVPLAASATPTISWVVPLERNGQRQSAFELELVGAARTASVWSSGIVEGSDPWMRIPTPLAANSVAIARVRTRDEYDAWSDWSSPLTVETGPHRLTDWHADWVAHPALHVLRREFAVTTGAEKARLHLTAQGLVRASVNGVQVNPDSSDPSRTDYSRALYRSYDVTDLLLVGTNTLDLEIAHGEWERTGLDPRVLASIVVDAADGSRVIAGTGTDLLVAASTVVVEQPFYLERQDLTPRERQFTPTTGLLVLDAADDPAGPSTPPSHVNVDPAPPIRVVQTIDARPAASDEVALTAGTARLWDVGVNVAGRSRVVIRSAVEAGTVVRVVHGEHIDDGHVDTTNLSMPYDEGRTRQSVEYILPATDAAGTITLEPRFCYHGFRYVDVIGLPPGAIISVQAAVLHTDLRQISQLTTDDTQVNALTAAAGRTLLNNVHGIPEDCPTREQSGWTGDTASVSEFEFSAFDMQTFFAKWIDDLLTSQQPSGWIPAIAPDLRPEKVPADPVWGGALQRVLWGHWLHYGDRELVQRCLPALRRWADFQLGCRTQDGVVGNSPISYGHDWLALEQTPPELHHTAATIDSLTILEQFERELGDPDAAELRRAQAEDLRVAARRAFVDPETATVGNGSQASYAIAMQSGWLTEAEAAIAAGRLEADVRARGNRVASGFAATRTVVRALAESGNSQPVFDALQQRAEPGVGAMLASGNGTFWECWWIDPTNTGTGSLDHLGLGGPFASWAWQTLAGVQPITSGYARFAVAPQLVAGIDELSLTTQTVRGTVHVAYRREGDELQLDITVPVGAEAVIRLPGAHDEGAAEDVVGSGEHTRRAPWVVGVARSEAGTHPEVGAHSEVGTHPEAWRPPSWAPTSADADGDTGLLKRAIAADAVVPAEATEVVVIDANLQCMPVPHAQLRGPIVLVRAASASRTPRTPSATLAFTPPLRADDATFAYAMIDLCLANTARPVRTELTVRAVDGSQRHASGKLWPAGWNRVTVDLGDWPGRTEIVSIEVAVSFAPEDSFGASDIRTPELRPPAFHIGEVGYSTLRRTWP
jgi:alpha-L-rhamnosidase